MAAKEDAKMTDKENTETKMETTTEKDATTKAIEEDEAEKAKAVIVIPPLQAAAQRLERLLGGGVGGTATSATAPTLTTARQQQQQQQNFHYTNPAKVVRRWLSTSSGAAGDATAMDIQSAAAILLDPTVSKGRALLVTSETIATTTPPAVTTTTDGGETTTPPLYIKVAAREVESWLISLAVRILWKEHKYAQAFELAQRGMDILLSHIEQASLKITTIVLSQQQSQSQSQASSSLSSSLSNSASSLFPLLARLTRWRSLAAESLMTSASTTVAAVSPETVHAVSNLRIDLAKAHNLATLRRDVDTQATLLNSMLRDLLKHSQVEQAQKLLSNSTFPESASNNQLCRYLYYSGRIQALRLEYTLSFSNLSQCLRKAPTNTGLGFRIAAQRLLVVVQLLMGEIPERHVFFTKGMKAELVPYLHITQAVRRGDLENFTKVVSEHASRYQQDGTYTLISRLAHQVVKAGLRKLQVSYSRLSLQDVADRLGLPSAKSAEFVVSKAVRDGVLDATIHHEEGYVQSHDLVDVYATKEPAEAFHRRIAYCLTTHNDAVRGMRYPPDAYKKQLEASRGNRRKRNDDKTDEEKAQELEDELDEEY